MDLYIVCDFMESDLHAVIKNDILFDVHKQFIIYQIVKALKYLHSAHLLHRDLKPSNVLLNSDCHVKLCDFGLARLLRSSNTEGSDTMSCLTDYVATRWYRSVELLLSCDRYSEGVDIWAVGCILAEMLLGRPLLPGTSTLDQIEKVFELTGQPTAEDLEQLRSATSEQLLSSVKVLPRKPLHELVPKAPPDALDFMQQCFQLDPRKRPSACELLNHPFVAQFHNEAKEPVCLKPIEVPLGETVKLTIKDYRNALYAEARKMRENLSNEPISYSMMTPPKLSVPQSEGKEMGHHASYLTPTTCHTNKGPSSPTTPPSSKQQKSASSKSLAKSPSTSSLGGLTNTRSVSVAQIRATTPIPAKNQAVPSAGYFRASAVIRSASNTSSTIQRSLTPQNSRPYQTQVRRVARAPSAGSVHGRPRAQSPSMGRRPYTGAKQ